MCMAIYVSLAVYHTRWIYVLTGQEIKLLQKIDLKMVIHIKGGYRKTDVMSKADNRGLFKWGRLNHSFFYFWM